MERPRRLSARYIRWSEEIGLADIGLVGGKNASLGELYRALVPLGVNVPNEFAVTADGYRDFLREVRGEAWIGIPQRPGTLARSSDLLAMLPDTGGRRPPSPRLG